MADEIGGVVQKPLTGAVVQRRLVELGTAYRVAARELRVVELRVFVLHEAEYMLHQLESIDQDWELFMQERVAQTVDFLDSMLSLHPRRTRQPQSFLPTVIRDTSN